MKIALFFAERVINNKQTFDTIPAKLKEEVKTILIERNFNIEQLSRDR